MREYADKMIDYAKTHRVPVVVLSDIGINDNGFAIGMHDEYDDWMIGFNLKIVDETGEEVTADEWCPKLKCFVPVARKLHARARFTNIRGETDTCVYGGVTARLLQQALDRINGVRISSRCSPFQREKALKEMKKARRNQRKVIDKVT
jgi:peptide deformylase